MGPPNFGASMWWHCHLKFIIYAWDFIRDFGYFKWYWSYKYGKWMPIQMGALTGVLVHFMGI
jgi:hypothetical protein